MNYLHNTTRRLDQNQYEKLHRRNIEIYSNPTGLVLYKDNTYILGLRCLEYSRNNAADASSVI